MEHLSRASHDAKLFISFNPQNNLMQGYCYYPCFALSEFKVTSNLYGFTQTTDG